VVDEAALVNFVSRPKDIGKQAEADDGRSWLTQNKYMIQHLKLKREEKYISAT
jgi:hypothetical protein